MFFDEFDGLHDYIWAAYCKQPPYTLKSNGIEGTYRQVRKLVHLLQMSRCNVMESCPLICEVLWAHREATLYPWLSDACIPQNK